MSKLIRLIWIGSLPLSFVTAGAGMLWLSTTLDPGVDFYQRLINHRDAWVGSHIVLMISAILLIPAAIALWTAVEGRRGTTLAGIGMLLAIPATVFLAGQYAIDFVMPLVAAAGEPAYPVHKALFSTAHIKTMFYGVPDLGPLGLLLMSVALALSGSQRPATLVALAVLWIGVIGGNILQQPLVARSCLLLLGFAYIPVARHLMKATSD
ncbi:MAG: hypothetical protein QNJ40_23795 [Xanthomonadales bacterium]|nr:hypothetical protein [Xanthomonadales bacterium]